MKIYRRKLSREDAEHRRVMLTKDRWRDFPSPGEKFGVQVGEAKARARIIAEECSCVGPQHEHRYIDASSVARRLCFKPGDFVEFSSVDGVLVLRNG
jgi:hypothetical protein